MKWINIISGAVRIPRSLYGYGDDHRFQMGHRPFIQLDTLN